MVYGYIKPPEVKPEDIIPKISEESSKFKATVSLNFEFNWNTCFAGSKYDDYDCYARVFKSDHNDFKTALFKLLLNDAAQYLSDYCGYDVVSGSLVSCDANSEIEKIYQDYKVRKVKVKAAADKLKAADLKKQAKELLLKAKQLEAK